jgi:hypothetical protein
VLRALEEVDTLRHRAEKAEQNAKMWEARAEMGVSVLKGMLLKDSPAAPKEDVKVPSATPLPNGAAGDVSPTPPPEAAAKWGRADGKGAFHLWREGFSEAECMEETCDGDVLFADPIPDNSCLSCAALAGWEIPEKLSLPPEKKKRNTPDLCVVDGCTEKGASRNQWCCGSHAAKLNLVERRAALDAWKKARMNGQAPALAGGTQ